MKTLSKTNKEVLTFILIWLCAYVSVITIMAAVSQTFDLGIAYFMVVIISGFIAAASVNAN